MEIVLHSANSKQGLMQVVNRTAELMPGGNPNFKEVRYYPAVQQLITEHGRTAMMNVLVVMIGQFCASFNVVRNMNDMQMIEAASMMLDECGNFRLEDYQMMFTMGKRGELVKVLDRIDINVIATMLDAYYEIRRAEGQRIQEEEFRKEDYTFNEQIDQSDFFSKAAQDFLQKQKEEEEAAELLRKQSRDEQIAAYAHKYNIDIDKVAAEFQKSKKNIPNNK